MPRPVILSIVGDSAAGKTTISGGLVDILGEEQVTHVGTDDYHKYDREQRKERDITPLHPDCNHMDIIAQHLALLRENDPQARVQARGRHLRAAGAHLTEVVRRGGRTARLPHRGPARRL